ncbi:cystinosin homolog isoform X2 [Bradysia coprophila]|uniref:cystinosin homolog isoform X2 n=1 Tax=Bradysia coprophila TaxID=38358 RepID=UPI00187D7BC9|nr:cystinosin homolog isoform X2 [Bradysia coprophila]
MAKQTALRICSTILVLLVLSANGQNDVPQLSIGPKDITVLIDETQFAYLNVDNGTITQNYTITFTREHPDLVDISPTSVEIYPDGPRDFIICIVGKSPGHLEITSNSTSNAINTNQLFVRVTVANSRPLIVLSEVVGWVYFVAWSVSFYPQIYINFKRKSVVGLNFDFLALNIVGFLMYFLFNAGLFWNKYIQAEYFIRFPQGLNPVLINDVVFALHAMVATLVTIVQCYFYERAQQRVSNIARIILGVFGICVIVFAILGGTAVIHWLDFLYYCSYIKLTITLIKYIPQAVMNYRRKSTVGWSIGNILLDFTGGILSMLQMLLNGYNYDDWSSIFGDPTKFGLGLFSVLFDILFMVQHYGLYRHSRKLEDNNDNEIKQNRSDDVEK